MELFSKGGEFAAKEVGGMLKEAISDRTLRLDLHDLKKMGKLRTTGKGPSTRWTLTQV